MLDDTANLNDKAYELFSRGDHNGARKIYEQVCASDNKNAEAPMMLGVIQATAGDIPNAINNLHLALKLQPDYADVYYYLGNIQQSQGQHTDAISNLERAIELDKDFADARQLLSQLFTNLANASLQQNKPDAAIVFFEKQSLLNPSLASNWFMLARTLAQIGKFTPAESCCRKAIKFDEKSVESHILLASFLSMQGKVNEANALCMASLKLDPNNINAISLAANIAKRMGEPERAYELISPLLKKNTLHINIALTYAMISKDLDHQQQAIDLMEKILHSDSSINPMGKSNLHFNLGELYDDIKQYDKAFSHYQMGNNLHPHKFNCNEHTQNIDQQIAVYHSDFLASLPKSTLGSSRPIFIVGMVRSGTSLVEQILSSHSNVFGAGELADIYQMAINLPEIINSKSPYPQCLNDITQQQIDELAQRYLNCLNQMSPDAQHVTDKLPGNFMYLGLIELLFPDAHIIHCMRDPADTCLSTYFQDFSSTHAYAYDLNHLGCFYNNYLKMMAHWRKSLHIPIFELNYEDLVAEPEKISRALIDFCDLEWEDNCLDFHKSKRIVRTASFNQVNRPVYKKSVARWKNYEPYLAPLFDALKHNSTTID